MFAIFRKAYLAFLASLAALALGTTAFAQDNVIQVADGVYAFDPGDEYNSMFIVTDEGVIVIEPVNSKHAAGMLEAIRSVTDQPVKFLLHSHNHWDHSNGGNVFREAGATIIAHEEAFAWMKGNPHPDLALPDESWSGDKFEITLGGTTLELHYFGMNHGLGMTVFLLPKEKVAYIADIVTPNRVLFAIVPDFNIKEWLRTLDEVAKLDFEQAVYSHSASGSPIGTKEDVTLTSAFITDMQAAIGAEFQKGTGFTDIPGAVKLPKYEHWAGYDIWLPLNVYRVMLDMWMGPFPWRAD